MIPENAKYGNCPDHFSSLMQAGMNCLNSPQSGGGGKYFDQALQIRPNDPEAITMRALAYEKDVDCSNGIEFCRKHLEQLPEDDTLLTVLANLYGEIGQSAEGLPYAEQAVELAPRKIRPIVALAFLQDKASNPSLALQTIDSAPIYLQEDPNLLLQRALILRNLGRSQEAAHTLQKVLQQHPSLSQAHSNLLLFIHDIAGITPEDIFKAHQQYDRHYAKVSPLTPRPISLQVRTGTAKPSFGFVSSDFREHSVAYFLVPLLKELHQRSYPVHLFNNNPVNDKISQQVQQLATTMDNIRGVGSKAAAEQIRNRAVDILIDLNGHTNGNRLDVFPFRPAPVQITWLGYPDTTGLRCMDYRFVDNITDPVEYADSLASEKLIRLRPPFLCYAPLDDFPEVSPPPFQKNGCITFGSFSNFAKTNPQTLQLWAKILQQVPDSRLCLKSSAFSDAQTAKLVLPAFLDLGIAQDRIFFHKRQKSKQLHLQMYDSIDIALDTFPYNGTTTTCEALYMGVPVVTLCGKQHCARVGASILESCGLTPLIATSTEDYLQRAVALSRQTDDLVSLRRTMRNRLEQSPLMDTSSLCDAFTAACSKLIDEQGN